MTTICCQFDNKLVINSFAKIHFFYKISCYLSRKTEMKEHNGEYLQIYVPLFITAFLHELFSFLLWCFFLREEILWRYRKVKFDVVYCKTHYAELWFNE